MPDKLKAITHAQLVAIIKSKMLKEKISLRGLETITGIPHTTLGRIANGKSSRGPSLLAVAKWAGYGLLPLTKKKVKPHA